MKKTISLLLALALCLSLCACGIGGSDTTDPTVTTQAPPIIGTWECLTDQKVVINDETTAGTQLLIHEDKTAVFVSDDQSIDLVWEYDTATRTIILYASADPTEVETFVYLEVVDSLSNDWYGLFARVE